MPRRFELLLLPDGPDPPPRGPAACFNRLVRGTEADTLILLASGMIAAPGWLEKLLSALAADPRQGSPVSPQPERAHDR